MAQLPLRTWTGSLCPPSASTEMCRSVCVKVPCLTAMENNQLPDGLPWLLTSVKCLLQNNSMKKEEELNSRIARKNGSLRRDSVHRWDGLTQTFTSKQTSCNYITVKFRWNIGYIYAVYETFSEWFLTHELRLLCVPKVNKCVFSKTNFTWNRCSGAFMCPLWSLRSLPHSCWFQWVFFPFLYFRWHYWQAWKFQRISNSKSSLLTLSVPWIQTNDVMSSTVRWDLFLSHPSQVDP